MCRSAKIIILFLFVSYLTSTLNVFSQVLMGGVSESVKNENLTGIGIIGIRFIHSVGYPSIVQEVYPSSPAGLGGVKVKDLIYSIDGVDTKTLNTNQVYRMLSGEPGSKVNIGILRNGKKYYVNLVRVDLATLDGYVQSRYLSGPVAVPFNAMEVFGY